MLQEAYGISHNHDMFSLMLAEHKCRKVCGLAAILAVRMWPVPRNGFLL